MQALQTSDGQFGDALTRRGVLRAAVAALALARLRATVRAQQDSAELPPYSQAVLPLGIRSRLVNDVNGIRMHVLEAGFETPGRPAVLLIHGFPELAYSWRKVMEPLGAAGFHVLAPDLRGYGRTSGADVKYADDLRPFGTLNKIRDMLALVSAMGYRSVAAVIGHDQGSPLAGWCALARPDVFRTVVMMSTPFGGPPALPFNTVQGHATAVRSVDANAVFEDLARLNPPRKHYLRYYMTSEANSEMSRPPQGIHAFLRAYYHMKSADWKQNTPFPLVARTATEWAKLPRYYVMDLHKGMAETVAAEMPSAAEIAACQWLPDSELRVYSEEYRRTGFQGGLNGYRANPASEDLQLFSGRTLDVPSLFIAGRHDWGIYQNPGALERLQKTVATKMHGTHLLESAGHWVQQEQGQAVSRLLLQFLQTVA